jgi:hypothetical protein
MSVKLAFTAPQLTAVAQVIEDNIGSNFQTRHDKFLGTVHLYAQATPQGRVKHYEIELDGTLVLDRG